MKHPSKLQIMQRRRRAMEVQRQWEERRTEIVIDRTEAGLADSRDWLTDTRDRAHRVKQACERPEPEPAGWRVAIALLLGMPGRLLRMPRWH